jgi:hypothetical protein
MDDLMKILLPTGIGILLVVLGAIGSVWDKGMEIAWSGDVSRTVDFIGDWVIFIVLVMLALALISAVAGPFQ